MSEEILYRHRLKWQQKPVLRALYQDWYQKIAVNLGAGKTLEIGGGTGNFKEFYPDALTSDIVHLPWLDLTMDAHHLPFRDGSLGNIVLFDVLHHLENPVLFFDEALRVLKRGGRILLMEPYVSPASFLIYRFLHSEPLHLNHDPFEILPKTTDRQAFDSNQGIPTLLFASHINRFKKKYPELTVKNLDKICFFAYPLSGGFDKPSLIPLCTVRFILLFERFFGFLSHVLAFRIFVVLESNKPNLNDATGCTF